MKFGSLFENIVGGLVVAAIAAAAGIAYTYLFPAETKTTQPLPVITATYAAVPVNLPDIPWDALSSYDTNKLDHDQQSVLKMLRRFGFTAIRYEITNNDDVIYRNVEIKLTDVEFLFGPGKGSVGIRLPADGLKLDLLPHNKIVLTALQLSSLPTASIIYENRLFEPIAETELAQKEGGEKAVTSFRRFNFSVGVQWLGFIVGGIWVAGMLIFQLGARYQWKKDDAFLKTQITLPKITERSGKPD